jgi:hypothetical protein
MSLKDDIASDVVCTMYDTDDFADFATWYSVETGITSSAFACIIADVEMHSDEEKNIVVEEDAVLSTLTTNINNVKKRDLITANGIIYEAVDVPRLDAVFKGISILWLRRKIETKI